jgi:hypothetical protein
MLGSLTFFTAGTLINICNSEKAPEKNVIDIDVLKEGRDVARPVFSQTNTKGEKVTYRVVLCGKYEFFVVRENE